MGDLPAWVAVGIGALGVGIAALQYIRRTGVKRIEYVLILRTQVIFGGLARKRLEVRYADDVLKNPALTILRLVSTGDQPVRREDYEGDLTVTLNGSERVMYAAWTRRRPDDLRPEIALDGDRVFVKPTLINPGDLLELQVLSEGHPKTVSVTGRIASLQLRQRNGLPYPPGSGPEGEMLGFDRFMWFIFTPGGIAAIGLSAAFAGDVTPTAQVLALVATVVAVALYLLQVRFLVQRRRIWRT